MNLSLSTKEILTIRKCTNALMADIFDIAKYHERDWPFDDHYMELFERISKHIFKIYSIVKEPE